MYKLIPSLTLLVSMVACSGGEDETEKDSTSTETSTETETETTTSTDTDTGTDTETADPDEVDDDGDGLSENDGDCDDTNADINPTAEDTVGDGVDNNCDGIDGVDLDTDGHASTASGGDDCDDEDPTINPSATEVENDGIDQDCNPLHLHLDLSCYDPDGDGTVDTVTTVQLTGPWWSWATEGENLPLATDEDGDGIYSIMFESPFGEPMEYKWLLDGQFEGDLSNAGFCADKLNPTENFANRLWEVGDGDTTEYPGTCMECGQMDWSSQPPTVMEIRADSSVVSVDLRFAWDWGVAYSFTPTGDGFCSDGVAATETECTDGGNSWTNIWSNTFDPAPDINAEFHLYGLDANGVEVAETAAALAADNDGDGAADLGPTCNAINTDYFGFFNRIWLVGSGDQCYNLNSCAPCE